MWWCWGKGTSVIRWRITRPTTTGCARTLRSTRMLRSIDLRRQSGLSHQSLGSAVSIGTCMGRLMSSHNLLSSLLISIERLRGKVSHCRVVLLVQQFRGEPRDEPEYSFARQTSHEGSWCQASICIVAHVSGPALSFFSYSDQLLTDVALWSCGRRTSVVQAQRQIHRVLAPYTVGGQRTRFPIEIAALR